MELISVTYRLALYHEYVKCIRCRDTVLVMMEMGNTNKFLCKKCEEFHEISTIHALIAATDLEGI